MANEYEKATSTARGKGRRRALAEDDQYQQMLQKLLFGTTGPVLLPGQRDPIFATKGEQSRYDNRYSIGRVTPSEEYQRFLDSGFGKREALPAITRTGVGVPAGVPEGTGIGPDGKLLAFADWKAYQPKSAPYQPKSAQGWGQAQQMVWNPMTRSYRPSQFSGEGLQQGLSYKSGYNLWAGNPSENASRYAAALAAMGGSIPSARMASNAARRNQPSRTFEERSLAPQIAAWRAERDVMREWMPTEEQAAAAKVQQALFENQQKLVLFVEQEQVRADFASAQQDAQFKTTVEQPMAQYLEDKYGKQWNAIVKNNPAAGPAMRIAFVSTLRRAQLNGESNLEKIADDWAKEWLVGPWYGKAKGAKLS